LQIELCQLQITRMGNFQVRRGSHDHCNLCPRSLDEAGFIGSHKSIRLGVGANARFNLDADTGSGTINVAQPITMQGSLNRHHVAGVVNGGGPTIRANTGSGDIQIK